MCYSVRTCSPSWWTMSYLFLALYDHWTIWWFPVGSGCVRAHLLLYSSWRLIKDLSRPAWGLKYWKEWDAEIQDCHFSGGFHPKINPHFSPISINWNKKKKEYMWRIYSWKVITRTAHDSSHVDVTETWALPSSHLWARHADWSSSWCRLKVRSTENVSWSHSAWKSIHSSAKGRCWLCL